MTIEQIQSIADPMRIGFMIAAMIVFTAIIAWTFARPRKEIEANANLWKDED